MLLSRIDLYPIKSLDGVSVKEARINAGGILEYDRIYAIIDETGAYVNGKRTGRVNSLRTQFAKDFQEAVFWVNGETRKQEFAFCEPEPLNRWLSDFFGFRVRLVCEPRNGFPDDRVASGPTITSEASLLEVARWFSELTLQSARRRFRCNLEIGGVQPFWEDHLFRAPGEPLPFHIGKVSFLGHNPCQRCIVPARDPDRGTQSIPNFQRAFMKLRKEHLPAWANTGRFNHFYRFAINTSVPLSEEGKTLRVGDPIQL
jgi:uncharacterized protein YcbX